jgi:hypothetical protein
MKAIKSASATFTALALMAGMTVLPLTVPAANAQISFHLGWQQPPHEYNDIQQQGFHAGIHAARHDMDHGLPPDPHRHGEFRHPEVGPGARDAFREAFRHGYETAYQHHENWR